MKERILFVAVVLLALIALAGCKGNKTEEEVTEADASLVAEDSLEDEGPVSEFEEVVQEMDLPDDRDEAFVDFIFKFVNDRHFQKTRVNYPLPSEGQDGSKTTIRSNTQFRKDFRWPNFREYTMLLTDPKQMEHYQNDIERTDAEVQLIDLNQQSVKGYEFHRNEGKWMLETRRQYSPQGNLADFLKFYDRFATDSVFQNESIAESLRYATFDSEDEMGSVEGTIESYQWNSIHQNILPHGVITNINVGQPLETSDKIFLLQCGVSTDATQTYEFKREGDTWKLVSYENF